MKIRLTQTETFIGAVTGISRQIASLFRGLPDKHGFTGDGWSEHIEGACGEIAASKALNQFWSPTVNTFKSPDVGKNYQVRTRSRHDYDLIIRPSDNQEDVFILVTGKVPEFEVRGLMRAAEARKEEWWKEHGGRPGAWFVPQTALVPIE